MAPLCFLMFDFSIPIFARRSGKDSVVRAGEKPALTRFGFIAKLGFNISLLAAVLLIIAVKSAFYVDERLRWLV